MEHKLDLSLRNTTINNLLNQLYESQIQILQNKNSPIEDYDHCNHEFNPFNQKTLIEMLKNERIKRSELEQKIIELKNKLDLEKKGEADISTSSKKQCLKDIDTEKAESDENLMKISKLEEELSLLKQQNTSLSQSNKNLKRKLNDCKQNETNLRRNYQQCLEQNQQFKQALIIAGHYFSYNNQ